MTYKRASNGTDEAVQARKKWDAENIARITIAVSKRKKDEIKAHAERQGVSIGTFIKRAIDEKIKNDEKKS